MKSINEYISNQTINNIEIVDEPVNESITGTATLLLAMTQLSAILCICLANADSDSSMYEQSILDRIKSWWKDKKAHKIIKKLAQDNDVQAFLQQPLNKQRGGWRELLKTKLDEKELDYITRITKDKVNKEINK